MQLVIRSRDSSDSRLRQLILNRMGALLRRLIWLNPRARVVLADVDGPRNGVDKSCRVELASPGLPPVSATSFARNWAAAFEDAFSRAARALTQLRQRRIAQRRHAPDELPFSQVAWAVAPVVRRTPRRLS